MSHAVAGVDDDDVCLPPNTNTRVNSVLGLGVPYNPEIVDRSAVCVSDFFLGTRIT